MLTYSQVKNPNLAAPGRPGYCLAYVEDVFGTIHKYPSATVGWASATRKHIGAQPPSNVSVPIWFKFKYPDGHVCVWVKGKVHTTTEEGVKVFDSIHALLDYMNHGAVNEEMVYLGWSEDLASSEIVRPVPSPTPTVKTAKVIHETYVRVAPNTSAALGGSRLLYPNDTFTYTEKVVGQMVNQNGVKTNLWYHSTKGHYVWSGNCKG